MKRARTDKIVIHCSATRPGQDIGADEIREWHIAKKYADIGYHFVIRRNGRIEVGRGLEEVGAHVLGHNVTSVGVCMVGGLDEHGNEHHHNPGMFTDAQWASLRLLVQVLRIIYPGARVCGHRDLSPDKNMDGRITPDEWLKTCPGFDVARMFPPEPVFRPLAATEEIRP